MVVVFCCLVFLMPCSVWCFVCLFVCLFVYQVGEVSDGDCPGRRVVGDLPLQRLDVSRIPKTGAVRERNFNQSIKIELNLLPANSIPERDGLLKAFDSQEMFAVVPTASVFNSGHGGH